MTTVHRKLSPNRPMRQFRAVVASALAVALMTGPAWAWGRLGHRVAGRIAEDRLNPAARKAVRDLLAPGESLADVSTWADEVRRDRPETSTWHYVNVPIAESKYDVRFEVPITKGVVTKVGDFRRILADPKATVDQRREALKFLAHFVEDMHQPLHVGHRDDRGGNNLQVQFFDKGSNLHSVWDSGLLERAGRTEPEWVARLEASITPELADAWAKGSPSDWADESLNAAKVAYRIPGATDELPKGAKLGQPYLDANLATAERRVTQAGVRLAVLLNAIFPE